jgi:hypothetical protein
MFGGSDMDHYLVHPHHLRNSILQSEQGLTFLTVCLHLLAQMNIDPSPNGIVFDLCCVIVIVFSACYTSSKMVKNLGKNKSRWTLFKLLVNERLPK